MLVVPRLEPSSVQAAAFLFVSTQRRLEDGGRMFAATYDDVWRPIGRLDVRAPRAIAVRVGRSLRPLNTRNAHGATR